jgi:hypothetical protein
MVPLGQIARNADLALRLGSARARFDPDFFSRTTRSQVALPTRSIELPIVYREVRAIGVYALISAAKAAALLPQRTGLRPILALPGRAVLGLIGFDYLDSSVGPYGEVAIGILCSSRGSWPMASVLFERRLSDTGIFLLHLPVTTEIAREAGRTLWGYPKFLADISFSGQGIRRQCTLAEGARTILEIDVPSIGRSHIEHRSFRTFTVQGSHLLKTTVPAQLEFQRQRITRSARVRFGEHPIARELSGLDLSPVLLEARNITRMQSILPAGERVRSIDGAETR